MRKIFKFLSSKIVLIAVSITFQLIVVLSGVYFLSIFSINAFTLFHILSFAIAIYVINRDDNPTYKMTWAIIIVALPVYGWILYVLFGAKQVPKALRERDYQIQKELTTYIEQNEIDFNDIEIYDPSAYKQIRYIWNSSAYPAYTNTRTTYFKTGEEKFIAMIEKLKQAERFIFLEYFIIDQGYMWSTILEILKEKVAVGVDVRLMYDDFGCSSKLPKDYHIYLNKMGIKTKVFNPLRPRLAVQMNNRDHRKIFVVDGLVAMSGGVNLADEYINEKQRFGHWKDGGAMIEGEAVYSFTLMFLQFWNYDENEKDDYATFRACDKQFKFVEEGIVQPFSDTPTDDENVGEYTHINMINHACDYVYITTPYLVIDQEMKTSLILAAKNGVDVRILVPHIPDKKYVFALTRHNFKELTKNGVRIFEYTPGFVHAKNFVSDDKHAIVGTTNMDFRSYYLHYECGIYFYKSKLIMDVKEDYLQTLNVSKEVFYEDCMKVKLVVRIMRAILNIFAPLM